MRYDYHAHSTYSDGRFMEFMIETAEEAGLEGIGFADHCNVSSVPVKQDRKRQMGFNLDLTYKRRREAIGTLRETSGIAVFDAVELDFEPDDEPAIRSFLEEADFDYAVGSVHDLDGKNVHRGSYFAEKPKRERSRLVDRYFEKQIALIESELFDIAAHPDLIERTPSLRELANQEHYERTAAAFAASSTVPEINAGRVLDEYGKFHPTRSFLETLLDYDVNVTLGTDSHTPEVIAPRVERLETAASEHDIEPVEIVTDQ